MWCQHSEHTFPLTPKSGSREGHPPSCELSQTAAEEVLKRPGSQGPGRILLADDHAMTREGMKAQLEREGFAVVGEASDGREAVRLSQELSPDVVVLDISMPSLNGIDAARAIMRGCPTPRVIVSTMHSDDSAVLSALRAGVKGYVLKSQTLEELVQAVREVGLGRTYLSPEVSGKVVQAYLSGTLAPSDSLSPREREILQLLAEGKSSKEIATILEISVNTVESHRKKITEKLDIHSIAGLVRYAIRGGLVPF